MVLCRLLYMWMKWEIIISSGGKQRLELLTLMCMAIIDLKDCLLEAWMIGLPH